MPGHTPLPATPIDLPLLPLRDALRIVLRLLRGSGRAEHHVATGGAFQLMLGGSSSQMVRISLKLHDPYIPEISANKYALNIRFIPSKSMQKNKAYEGDVPFELTFCNL